MIIGLFGNGYIVLNNSIGARDNKMEICEKLAAKSTMNSM